MTTPTTSTRTRESDVDDVTGVGEPRRSRFRPSFLRLPSRLRLRRAPDRWLAREQRRRRLTVALTLVALVVAGVAVWAVAFSSWLSVKSVDVIGLSEEGQAAGAVEVTDAASIALGTPIARIDAAAVGDRVNSLAWVETVEVRRAWPDSIVIAVSERQPVAVVESEPTAAQGGSTDGEPVRQGVDAEGVVFDPPGGLWLTGPTIKGEPSAVPEAVRVVAGLPESIARRVRVVQAVSSDDIRLQLGNDAIVRWGNATEPDFKAQVLEALLQRRAAGYDVSAPELPTTFNERGPKK